MEGWFEFALERYNYWIVIILMMTGLYIVFARGNLVKKVVGLNLFQTSVFIFYITIGKISGGTAPIFINGGYGGHGKDGHSEDGHGGGHGAAGADAGAGAEADAGAHGQAGAGDALHGKIDNLPANDLKAATDALGLDTETGAVDAPSLHEAPAGMPGNAPPADKLANEALTDAVKPADGFDVAGEAGAGEAVADAAHGAAEGALADALSGSGVGEIVYTNPLPHVLILTAIVVGVATTAVGLALAVRIREAYGTIEEDELHALDNIAEFGHQAGDAVKPQAAGGAA